MPTRLHFEFYGDAQVDRTLDAIEGRAQDASPVWDVIADRFLHVEEQQFASEGGWGSGGWPALSPAYAAWKQAHYSGRPILVLTGDLERSLTDGPAVRVIRPDRMWIGSDVAHGRYHQLGDGVPQRRPIDLPEDERRQWARHVQRFLRTGATR